MKDKQQPPTLVPTLPRGNADDHSDSGMGSHAGAWEPEKRFKRAEGDVVSNLVRLSEVAKINPRPPKDIDEGQVVSFLPMAAVSENGYVAFEEKRIFSEVKKGFTYFERGDFLIAKITPCFENGKAALTCNIENPIGYGSTEFHVIRPIPQKLDKNYLYHLLWSEQFRFYGRNKMRGAAGQKRVTADLLKDYRIPLPPLKEQKRIAAILDKADAIRRKRRQAIDLTDQLLCSVFLDMFGDPVTNPKGWEQLQMAEVLDLITYGLTVRPTKEYVGKPTFIYLISLKYPYFPGYLRKPCRQINNPLSKYVEKGFYLISAKEIRSGSVDFGSAKLISEDDFEKLSDKGKPQKGEILFSKTGSIGHCAIIETDEKFAITQNAARLRFKEDKILSEFALYYMRTKRFQFLAKSRAKGNAVKDLQLGDFKEFLIYCPPIIEQKKFIQILNKQKNIERKFFIAYDLTRLNFDSLTQRAFNGKLSKQTKAA